ncbi:hypothetical protein G7085_01225 [Tessaracoccus sp. HDW20]|uniref:hypothetical protein n=1 Tax=Tessaracoccus coleopterorum TaxID=2714950 RepID=UPI0018D2BA41|nr:hypothetical protein [Tessaracoccus coleopterorum]NHB83786.1 hypothetical protein [Tessaracoccus coleopterorum]
MALFKRTDPVLFAGLDEELGGRADVLAHATGEDGVVVAGTREAFAVGTHGSWEVWPWERVGGGSWKAEQGRFRWKTVDGVQHEVALSDPQHLPQLFRERVEASTVVQVLIDAPVRGEVQIVGRRSLGRHMTMSWYAVASGGADLSDPATSAAVVAETDRLKSEYFSL